VNPPLQSPVSTSAWVPLRAILGLIGFSATIAQVVIMRELMVVFYGNEISLGMMLAAWLLWTGIGSGALGKLAARPHDPRRLMAGLQLILALALPGTILAVRASRTVFHPTAGELLGPVPMILTCLVTLSCFCVVSGCLFAAGSRLYAHQVMAPNSAATSSVYLLEAAGSCLGGILASLLLIRYFASIQITLLISVLNLLAAVILAIRTIAVRRALTAILLIVFLFVSLPINAEHLQGIWLARLWPGFHLVTTRNSVYGNVAVVETPGTRSLFENGLLMFNSPDVAAAEESVHFALLQQPSPKSLLLIGGGASGSLMQALQHPTLQRVDYVELDPTILDLAQQYFPDQWRPVQADPRLHVHHVDGRLFLKATQLRFDVILVNLPEPQTAQLNRFYTLEFFQEAAEKLTPTGILSFQLHAAEEYISPQLGLFLRCINKTLREVFPQVTAIPGETVHFFAAKQDGVLTSDPQELLSRLRSRHIRTIYVREYYIPFRMMPDRMLDLERQIQAEPQTLINRDFTPIAYYFDIGLWSTQFNQAYRRIFASIAQTKFAHLALGTAGVLLLIGITLRSLPRPLARTRASIALCIAAMGLTLIGLEVFLLLAFQAIYGYVYHQLSILISFFMAGMALGTWGGMRRTRCNLVPGSGMLTIMGLQLIAALAPILLCGIFSLLAGIRGLLNMVLVAQLLFPSLALISGLLGGFQFPVASRLFFASAEKHCGSLGTLYAADLAGACIGALVLSAYLIPVFGFLKSAVLIAAVNLVPALLAGSLAFAKADSLER
jgi:spermidine synthase